jgi:ribosomal-protein-alanine N-acetyltransferase
MQFYTERLIIRDHVLDDLTELHELLSDEKSMRYLPEIKTKDLNESRENLINSVAEAGSKERKLFFFRIEKRITKEYIGEIGYTVTKETPFGKIADMGYFIKEKHWGKGYATEALKRMIECAFEDGSVYRISTGCIKENKGSERVMIKCGMIKEAEYKEYQLHENILKDRVEYRLIKHEWKK